MNRLRFRVWDKEVQEFAHWPVYFNLTNSEIVTELWYGYEIQVEEPLQDSNYIVQQSTGLLDKNGKEIYEGDIVKIDDHPLQVCTSKISGVPIGVNINGNYVVEYSTEDMAYFIGNWKTREVIRYSEVIGNKFEHSHLLGEE